MDTNETGQYALVIPRVDTGHAGLYRCDDDEGLVKGEHPAELTVLGENIFVVRVLLSLLLSLEHYFAWFARLLHELW